MSREQIGNETHGRPGAGEASDLEYAAFVVKTRCAFHPAMLDRPARRVNAPRDNVAAARREGRFRWDGNDSVPRLARRSVA
jgi:hypothetical protein